MEDRGEQMTGWVEQIVIVTGGSRGIGRAISQALAARGAAICINYATRAVEAEATWRSFCRAPASIRSISTARITSIPMVRSRWRRSGLSARPWPRPVSSGSGVSPSAGANGWLWRSRAVPRWRCSRCAAAGEVRAPQFGSAEGDLDAEMVAIAGAIIRQRTGNFDPSTYRDRYQDALQQLIEAKMKGLTIKPRPLLTPSPVVDLMAALKRSLAQEPSAPEHRTTKGKQTKQAPDRRQPALLLPLTGARKRNQRPATDPAATGVKKRSSTR
jgi:hypothetical protein